MRFVKKVIAEDRFAVVGTVLALSAILFLFLLPLFGNGIPKTHDSVAQIARFSAYYQSIRDGQIPPRWAGNLNYGFGSPVLSFFYPLAGYLASIVYATGLFSLEAVFKLLLGIFFVGCGLSFFFWQRKSGTPIAILGALLYSLSPYQFINLYVRGDIGELAASCFAPLVLWAVDESAEKTHQAAFLWGGLFIGLLILSHNIASIMFLAVIGLYTVYIFSSLGNEKRLRFVIRVSGMFLLGFGLSAFFWLPAFVERKYTLGTLFVGSMYQNHFLTLPSLIVKPWGFAPDVAKPGGLSPQLGVGGTLIIITLFILFATRKVQKKSAVVFWTVIFIIGVILTVPISTIVWKMLPLIAMFQFPWRFFLIINLSSAAIIVELVKALKFKRRILYVLSAVAVVSTFPFLKVNGYETHADEYYHTYTGTTYFHGQTTPVWTAGDAGAFAKSPVEVIGGKGIVALLLKKSNLHVVQVMASEKVTILDNTVYFPGWRIYDENTKAEIPIQFQDPNHRGLITFSSSPGIHTITVAFTRTKIRTIGELISICSLFVVLVYWAYLLPRKKQYRKIT